MGMLDSTNVIETLDGIDANEMWNEFQAALADYNTGMDALVASLTFPTTQENFQVLQGSFEFEKYADYTLPDAQDLGYASISVPIDDWDLRVAYTFARILETTSVELNARHSTALKADVRLQMREVLRAALRKEGVTYNGVTSKPFYNADGVVPPTYKTNTFDATHTHYAGINGSTGLGTALSAGIDHLVHHGFESEIVAMCNRATAKLVKAQTGFVKVEGAVGTDRTIVGAPDGANVVGWFDDATVIQEDWMPANFVFLTSVQGGANSPDNPLAFRESQAAGARGLILKRGTDPDYPLVDSFYYRKFGTGVRQRGNGYAIEIGSDTTYDSPTAAVL